VAAEPHPPLAASSIQIPPVAEVPSPAPMSLAVRQRPVWHGGRRVAASEAVFLRPTAA
jgi:hypothetical protein